MSLYYKNKFVSSLPLFSEVKETLKSYFNTGAIDDVMFPKWTEHCLRRFRKGQYKIEETLLEVKDYVACLPADFNSVREVWMCSLYHSDPIRAANSFYYQKDCRIEDPAMSSCDPCFSTESGCSTEFLVTHKVTKEYMYSFTRTHLLKPGNINTHKHCGDYCPNKYSNDANSFDIADGKLITNFCDGTVHLIYYSDALTEDGEQLIPDDFWIQDFIRKFLIYKCFEQLSNQITDETFNQVMEKLQMAKQAQEEAFIIADTESKKQNVYEKMRQITVSYNLNNKYRIR